MVDRKITLAHVKQERRLFYSSDYTGKIFQSGSAWNVNGRDQQTGSPTLRLSMSPFALVVEQKINVVRSGSMVPADLWTAVHVRDRYDDETWFDSRLKMACWYFILNASPTTLSMAGNARLVYSGSARIERPHGVPHHANLLKPCVRLRLPMYLQSTVKKHHPPPTSASPTTPALATRDWRLVMPLTRLSAKFDNLLQSIADTSNRKSDEGFVNSWHRY